MISQLMLGILIAVLIFSSGASRPTTDCETGCLTKVVVTDCEGSGVKGVKVEIQLRCENHKQVTNYTDSDGSVVFPYCIKDIDRSQISVAGVARKSFDDKICSVNGKNARCSLQVCEGKF